MKKKLSFLVAFVFLLTLVIGILPAMGSDASAAGSGNILTVTKSVPGDPVTTEAFTVTVRFTHDLALVDLDGISSPGLSGTYVDGVVGRPGIGFPGTILYKPPVQEVKPTMTFTFPLSEAGGTVTFSNIPVGTTYTVNEAITATQTSAGWSSAGISYDDPDQKIELTISGDDDHVTVNNTYTPTTFSVIYDEKNGSGGPADENNVSNGNHTLLLTPEPTKVSDASFNYAFGGWSATDGGTTAITEVTIADNDVTVYAIWIATPIQAAQTYSVFYDENDGSGGPADENNVSNGSHTLLLTPEPKKVSDASFNYAFGGWSATDGGTTAITEVTIADNDVTVYAIWIATPTQAAQTYSVFYDENDGSGGPADESSLSNGSHTLLLTPEPTKVSDASFNYAFGGWSATDGGTTAITEVTIADNDVTVYAIWIAKEIYEPNPDFATLTVTKQVSGSSTTDAFEIEVAFSYDSESSLEIATSGTGTVSDHQGDTYTILLKNGEYIRFSDIYFGTTYTVKEKTVLSGEWTTSGEVTNGAFYNIDDNTYNSSDDVVIVNTYKANEQPAPAPAPITIESGTLTVDKTVSSIDPAVTASGTEKFAFTVTFTANPYNVLGVANDAGLSGNNGVYSFTLSANDKPVTFSNIPVGTTYTVSEKIDASSQKGWTEGDSTGKTGTITTAGASAVIANVYAAAAGVAGASDSSGNNDSSDQAVAGDVVKLPQTGGISPATLLGVLGMALVAAGGTAFTILRKKDHRKDN